MAINIIPEIGSTLRNLALSPQPTSPIRLLRDGYPTPLGCRVQLENM